METPREVTGGALVRLSSRRLGIFVPLGTRLCVKWRLAKLAQSIVGESEQAVQMILRWPLDAKDQEPTCLLIIRHPVESIGPYFESIEGSDIMSQAAQATSTHEETWACRIDFCNFSVNEARCSVRRTTGRDKLM